MTPNRTRRMTPTRAPDRVDRGGARRFREVGAGLAALIVLAAAVVGIPFALIHYIGWPLPHHLPTGTQLDHALTRTGIPDRTLIDALALVVWATWALLITSLAVDITASIAGRHPTRRLGLAAVFQPVTAPLVALVVIAALTFTPRPSPTRPVPLAHALQTTTGTPAAAQLGIPH